MDPIIKQEPPIEIDGNVQEIPVDNETSCSEYEFNSPESEMCALLKDWGLEILIERFSQNMIDISVLDLIVDVDIIDLCRDLPMRYRLILRHKLKEKCFKQTEPLKRKRKKSRSLSCQNDEQPSNQSSSLELPKPKSHKETVDQTEANELFTRQRTIEQLQKQLQRERGQTIPNEYLVSVISQKLLVLEGMCYGLDKKCEQIRNESSSSGLLREPNDEAAGTRNFLSHMGLISGEKLQKFSDESSSDYIFLKCMMDELWPEGFVGRTVTGRASNNVHGCRGKNTSTTAQDDPTTGNPTGQVDQSPKVPLEAYKVDYIKDRLLERRLMMGDNRLAALHEVKHTNKLMARVIVNCNQRQGKKQNAQQ